MLWLYACTFVADEELAQQLDQPPLTDSGVAAHLGAGVVGTNQLADGAVTTVKLADDAVTAAKIEAGAVRSAQIEDGAVTAADLGTECVGSDQIADGSVGAAELADDAVRRDELADGAVGSAEIADGSITEDDLQDGLLGGVSAVDGDDVVDESLSGDDIADGSITTADIATGTLSASDLGSGSVGSDEIAAGAVGSSEIASSAVGSDQIASSAVTSSEIASDAVGSGEIATDAVGSAEISASAVDDSELSDSIGLGAQGSSDGYLYIYDASASASSVMSAWGSTGTHDTVGTLVTKYGSTGYYAAFIGAGSTYGYGFLGVSGDDDTTCCDAGMYVNSSGEGIVFGDTKSFVVPDPRDPEQRIVYASIEGPEAAAYIRGTAHLEDGIAVVEFADHFRLIASPEGLSAQVTPASAASRGLAVTELGTDFMVVEELDGGQGEYDFYWRVEAVRAGHEDFRVIRPAAEFRGAAVAN